MSNVIGQEILVSRAQANDAEGIAPLCAQLGYPCTQEEVLPRLIELIGDEEHAVFVAKKQDGTIIGWVHSYLYKLFYASVAAEIGGLVVDENYRGYGAGRKLMQAVEVWAKSKGCMVVSLRSNTKRTGAHAFYSNIGYEKVKEQYTFRKYF